MFDNVSTFFCALFVEIQPLSPLPVPQAFPEEMRSPDTDGGRRLIRLVSRLWTGRRYSSSAISRLAS
jgi:hypothetical protein